MTETQQSAPGFTLDIEIETVEQDCGDTCASCGGATNRYARIAETDDATGEHTAEPFNAWLCAPCTNPRGVAAAYRRRL